MNELHTHIQAINAKSQAWMDEDPENRWAGMIVDDLSYWAENGITTVAQFERSMLESAYSDIYKDIYGFRPRGINFDTITTEELQQKLNNLVK